MNDIKVVSSAYSRCDIASRKTDERTERGSVEIEKNRYLRDTTCKKGIREGNKAE